MTNTEFSILVLALFDSRQAGKTSLMDAQTALSALCRAAGKEYDYAYYFARLV